VGTGMIIDWLSEGDKQAIFEDNARRVFRL
jgi:hypothetical protein